MTENKFVTIRQLANAGVISEHAARVLVADGVIPSFKVGNRSLIDYNAAIKALEDLAKGGDRDND